MQGKAKLILGVTIAAALQICILAAIMTSLYDSLKYKNFVISHDSSMAYWLPVLPATSAAYFQETGKTKFDKQELLDAGYLFATDRFGQTPDFSVTIKGNYMQLDFPNQYDVIHTFPSDFGGARHMEIAFAYNLAAALFFDHPLQSIETENKAQWLKGPYQGIKYSVDSKKDTVHAWTVNSGGAIVDIHETFLKGDFSGL